MTAVQKGIVVLVVALLVLAALLLSEGGGLSSDAARQLVDATPADSHVSSNVSAAPSGIPVRSLAGYDCVTIRVIDRDDRQLVTGAELWLIEGAMRVPKKSGSVPLGKSDAAGVLKISWESFRGPAEALAEPRLLALARGYASTAEEIAPGQADYCMELQAAQPLIVECLDHLRRPLPNVHLVMSRATFGTTSDAVQSATVDSLGFAVGPRGIASAVSGDDGLLEVDGLPPGDYYCWVEHSSYIPRTPEFGGARLLRLPAGKEVCEFTPVLAAVARMQADAALTTRFRPPRDLVSIPSAFADTLRVKREEIKRRLMCEGEDLAISVGVAVEGRYSQYELPSGHLAVKWIDGSSWEGQVVYRYIEDITLDNMLEVPRSALNASSVARVSCVVRSTGGDVYNGVPVQLLPMEEPNSGGLGIDYIGHFRSISGAAPRVVPVGRYVARLEPSFSGIAGTMEPVDIAAGLTEVVLTVPGELCACVIVFEGEYSLAGGVHCLVATRSGDPVLEFRSSSVARPRELWLVPGEYTVVAQIGGAGSVELGWSIDKGIKASKTLTIGGGS